MLVQCLRPKVSNLPEDIAAVSSYRHRTPCVQPRPAVKHMHSRQQTKQTAMNVLASKDRKPDTRRSRPERPTSATSRAALCSPPPRGLACPLSYTHARGHGWAQALRHRRSRQALHHRLELGAWSASYKSEPNYWCGSGLLWSRGTDPPALNANQSSTPKLTQTVPQGRCHRPSSSNAARQGDATGGEVMPPTVAAAPSPATAEGMTLHGLHTGHLGQGRARRLAVVQRAVRAALLERRIMPAVSTVSILDPAQPPCVVCKG